MYSETQYIGVRNIRRVFITLPKYTARKVYKYGVFSGLYSARERENLDQEKLRI